MRPVFPLTLKTDSMLSDEWLTGLGFRTEIPCQYTARTQQHMSDSPGESY